VSDSAEVACVYCGGAHLYEECPANPVSANYVNNFTQRPSGSLPSTTEKPASNSKDKGKETCKVITLRSETEYEGPSIGTIVNEEAQERLAEDSTVILASQQLFPAATSKKSSPDKAQESPAVKTHVATETAAPSSSVLVRERPPSPFPQRLRKVKEDKQFDKFIEIMKQLHINFH
jgi:hypothetical protein